jgi:Chalcone isomerase-like
MIVPHFRVGAYAAEPEEGQVPDVLQVNGKTLFLNGFGQRTYPVLGIHIYVVSLYLEHLSTNPDEVIHSPEIKLLAVRFQRDISVEDARNAWRTNLQRSCAAPCRLNPNDVEKFLSEVPAMHEGDIFHLLFSPSLATVTLNGRQIGTISEQQFAEAMLGSFVGPGSDLPVLRQELLRGRFTNVPPASSVSGPSGHQQ